MRVIPHFFSHQNQHFQIHGQRTSHQALWGRSTSAHIFHIPLTNTDPAKFIGSIFLISSWWFGTFLVFPYIENVIIPIDVHIFQRGRSGIPPTRGSRGQVSFAYLIRSPPSQVHFGDQRDWAERLCGPGGLPSSIGKLIIVNLYLGWPWCKWCMDVHGIWTDIVLDSIFNGYPWSFIGQPIQGATPCSHDISELVKGQFVQNHLDFRIEIYKFSWTKIPTEPTH